MPNQLEAEFARALDGKWEQGQGLRTLAVLVAQMPEDAWDKLSDQAKEWSNRAIRATNTKVEVPALPEFGTTTYDDANRSYFVVEALQMPDVFASVCWARFEALRVAGFDSQQALELVCAGMRGV